jgi:glycine hydroxymethyltransferase
MKNLEKTDSEIFKMISREQVRQQHGLELIASENYASSAVMEAMGCVLTNKYSEGYVGKRYYAGNQIVDEVEALAIERAKELFAAEHVNVQPLSGSPANAAVYFACIKPGDKVLGLALDHGGHLSHGHPVNFSGILYNFVQYTVDRETGRIDMDEVEKIAKKEKPKMILAGFSAYSREMEWQRFKDIADDVGAVTFADIAHTAGLIAGKQLVNPVPIFDIVTTTTHKTLRGPRGGMIMCKQDFVKPINRAVFPGMQGGPHDHITAAKAVAFKEALEPEFQDYSAQTIKNAQVLAETLMQNDFKIITDGTDNHLMVVDMTNKGLSGKEAEIALESGGISTSRSTIPYDPRKPFDPSGVRLGTPAITTRGMKEKEMQILGELITFICHNAKNETKIEDARKKVEKLCKEFPIYN